MELEEATKMLQKIVKSNNDVVKEARTNGDINAMQLTADLDNQSIAIETVLQLLKDKENKINKCIETINQLKTGEYIKGPKHYYSSLCCNARLDIIQELLEGK